MADAIPHEFPILINMLRRKSQTVPKASRRSLRSQTPTSDRIAHANHVGAVMWMALA